jgi:hypothetical protein
LCVTVVAAKTITLLAVVGDDAVLLIHARFEHIAALTVVRTARQHPIVAAPSRSVAHVALGRPVASRTNVTSRAVITGVGILPTVAAVVAALNRRWVARIAAKVGKATTANGDFTRRGVVCCRAKTCGRTGGGRSHPSDRPVVVHHATFRNGTVAAIGSRRALCCATQIL